MNAGDIQLAHLVDMNSPAAVLEEAKNNFIQSYPVTEFTGVRKAFNAFLDLYAGRYPGYKACNTRFHDVMHTTDAFLAVSRLIDGCNSRRPRLPVGLARVALIATLFHDTGYIQRSSERGGTGAKHTLNHVRRSMDFARQYFRAEGLPAEEARAAARMVSCTGLGTDIGKLRFSSPKEKTLGLMLGAADLLGQMSSRAYLERLLYLYKEFREGGVKGFSSEYDLLKKTMDFYEGTLRRFAQDLGGVDRYARDHFRNRYRIDCHLYRSAIDRQMKYLAEILSGGGKTALRRSLRRGRGK